MELSVEKPKSIEKLYDENSGLWKFVRIDKGPTRSVEIIEKAKLEKAKYSLSTVDDGLPTYILADDGQLLLLIRTNNGKKKVASLWTNYDAFIKALKVLFLELWSNEA